MLHNRLIGLNDLSRACAAPSHLLAHYPGICFGAVLTTGLVQGQSFMHQALCALVVLQSTCGYVAGMSHGLGRRGDAFMVPNVRLGTSLHLLAYLDTSQENGGFVVGHQGATDRAWTSP